MLASKELNKQLRDKPLTRRSPSDPCGHDLPDEIWLGGYYEEDIEERTKRMAGKPTINLADIGGVVRGRAYFRGVAEDSPISGLVLRQETWRVASGGEGAEEGGEGVGL